MPIYGYVCNRCDHDFETLVRSDEIAACPSCGSADLSRQLSRIAAPPKSGGDAPMCDGAGGCGMCCAGMDH